MCNDRSCSDNPFNHSNSQSLSPIFTVLDYHLNNSWKFTADSIWNPITKQLDNSTLTFQYQPDEVRLLNLGYRFARNGDILSGISTNDSRNNLKVTDVSAAWPLIGDFSGVARWSQNWNHAHLQNLLYGLQYDTCCWQVRLVGGRAFIGIDPNNNNKPQYNSEFYIEFSLKGFGDIPTGNPRGLLNSINGYKSHFGQDYT
jgi:LPS-assembly protein